MNSAARETKNRPTEKFCEHKIVILSFSLHANKFCEPRLCNADDSAISDHFSRRLQNLYLFFSTLSRRPRLEETGILELWTKGRVVGEGEEGEEN